MEEYWGEGEHQRDDEAFKKRPGAPSSQSVVTRLYPHFKSLETSLPLKYRLSVKTHIGNEEKALRHYPTPFTLREQLPTSDRTSR
jgi:hypothetical protein